MRLLQKRAEKIFYEISFLIRYFSRQPHSISMSGAREENRSRAAMWVTVRPRISWWTALTVFLLLHSGEEKDFSPFLSPPRTFPLTHPTEMQRHKPGPAIPLPDLKTLPGGILKAFFPPGGCKRCMSGPAIPLPDFKKKWNSLLKKNIPCAGRLFRSRAGIRSLPGVDS